MTFSHINKGGFTISLLIVICLSISLISIVIGQAFAKTTTRKKHNKATKVGVQIYTQQYLTAEVLKLLQYTWGLIGPGFTIIEIIPEQLSILQTQHYKGDCNRGTMCWESVSVNKDWVDFMALGNACHLIQFIKICLLNFVGQNDISSCFSQ